MLIVNKLLLLITPFVCAGLFRLGGWGRFGFLFIPFASPKLWRWIGIGAWISFVTGNWWHFPAYFIATNVLGYGESHPMRKIFGHDGAWLVYGMGFGLASGVLWQGILGMFAFWVLMELSNKPFYVNEWWHQERYLDHKWVEMGFGFLGTVAVWRLL